MFKTKECAERVVKMHEMTQKVLHEMEKWFFETFGHEFEVTETLTTLEEDQALNRASSSHREGRAFDIGTRSWTSDMLSKFNTHFSKYEKFGAIGKESGKRIFMYEKPHGSGPHIHVQIGRDVIEQYNKGIIPLA